ncbi:ABC transporter permease [Phytohabitans suffuscus]|uniref:ABC transporter permease n=1 Tax=Phytohabitans suffuscus TaxID=624315 RepID=A0A6F8Z0U9_9ACTN|nr:ABC transporter permease subunit [Phytohabitans suffuscus]BCB92060.1 ABC transporter permease [Phytohabitans suffuscus]
MTTVTQAPPAAGDSAVVVPPSRSSARLDKIWRVGFGVIVAALLLFLLAPLVVVILTAFNDRLVAFPPQGWSLQSFRSVPGYMFEALWLSVQVAALATVIAMLLAFPATIALVRGEMRGKAALLAFFQSPLQVPAIVQGLALYQLYIALNPFGVALRGSFTGLLIGHVILVFPFILNAMLGRVAAIDTNLELASYGLGAGFLRTTWLVTLPLMRPALIAAGFLAFLVSFDDTSISLFLTQVGGATLPLTLLYTSEQALSPMLYAMSALVIVFSLVLALIVDRVFGLRTVMSRD